MWDLDHEEQAEHGKTDAFKLWCWRRLLRVPCTARRSKRKSILKSVLKEINPGYPLKGLLLKIQYFGHLIWRADSLEKILVLGKIEGRRRGSWQRMRRLDSITNSTDINLNNLWEIGKYRRAWCGAVLGVAKSQMWLSNWTTKSVGIVKSLAS